MLNRAAITASAGNRPNSMLCRRQFSVVWSWRSPPETLIAMIGFPFLRTKVGVRAILGRLPGSIRFG